MSDYFKMKQYGRLIYKSESELFDHVKLFDHDDKV